MGVSLNDSTPQSPPQNDHFLVGKPMVVELLGTSILGTPHMFSLLAPTYMTTYPFNLPKAPPTLNPKKNHLC